MQSCSLKFINIFQSLFSVLSEHFRRHCAILCCATLGAEPRTDLPLTVHLPAVMIKPNTIIRRLILGTFTDITLVFLYSLVYHTIPLIMCYSFRHLPHNFHSKDVLKAGGPQSLHTKDGRPATLADIDPMALDTSIRFQNVGG